MQKDREVQSEHTSLKRANSSSPTGVKSKSSKKTNNNEDILDIEIIHLSDTVEDFKLLKQES